jgi:flagellar biosynthesis/type III secretory pathway protein FliH
VIPRAEAAGATAVAGAGGGSRAAGHPPMARVMTRPVAEARAEADALLKKAREEAQQILSRAEATASDLIFQQQARARADALCLVVGEALELRKRQAELTRNVLDRSIGFATHASELRAGLAGLGTLLDSIEVEDDDSLERGHLRVETELGVIEADVRGQLERLATQLKKILTSHGSDTA